jgi:hypothetical protein
VEHVSLVLSHVREMSFTKIVSLAPEVLYFIYHTLYNIKRACPRNDKLLIETEFNLMCESILNSILRKLMTERLKLLSTKIVPTLCEETNLLINIKFLALKNCYKSRIRRCVAKCKNQSSLDELSIIAGQRRFDLIKSNCCF